MKTRFLISLVAFCLIFGMMCIAFLSQKEEVSADVHPSIQEETESVMQEEPEPVMQVETSEITIDAEGGEVSIDIDTQYTDITTAGWVTQQNTLSDTSPTALVFSVDKNNSNQGRTSTIKMIGKNRMKFVTLTQTGGTIPNNQIWYTSTNGEIVVPSERYEEQDNMIVSNTYENGQGIITFTDEITTIPRYMFYHCDNLKSIVIPNSVISIGNFSFAHCSNLENVKLSKNITLIAGRAFSACYNLQSINLEDNIEDIGDEAFEHCSHLVSINIPSSLTKIRHAVFYECSRLQFVNIPSGITEIGYSAFEGCAIVSITIPDNVKIIDCYAFASNKEMTEATIGRGVVEIGESAFDCDGLRTIGCMAITPPIKRKEPYDRWDGLHSIFGKEPSDIEREILVPSQSIDLYNSSVEWGGKSNHIIKPLEL